MVSLVTGRRSIVISLCRQCSHKLEVYGAGFFPTIPMLKNLKSGIGFEQDTLADTEYKFVNRRINRAVQNNNLVMRLIECLSYKGKLRGQAVKKFDERGTARTCVVCDHEQKKALTRAYVHLFARIVFFSIQGIITAVSMMLRNQNQRCGNASPGISRTIVRERL